MKVDLRKIPYSEKLLTKADYSLLCVAVFVFPMILYFVLYKYLENFGVTRVLQDYMPSLSKVYAEVNAGEESSRYIISSTWSVFLGTIVATFISLKNFKAFYIFYSYKEAWSSGRILPFTSLVFILPLFVMSEDIGRKTEVLAYQGYFSLLLWAIAGVASVILLAWWFAGFLSVGRKKTLGVKHV